MAPLIVGIAGGTGSGKSWLARAVAAEFSGRAAVIYHDWYYKNNSHVSAEEALELNFDHPDSLETSLLCRHIDELKSGRAVEAPVYDYRTHSRLLTINPVAPADLLIVDGILILQNPELRSRLHVSVFIDVPADIRLSRRVRRDMTERRIDVDETLRLYEETVRPMHEQYVAPSARYATWRWSQLDDENFPIAFLRNLKQRLDLPVAVGA